MRKKLFAVIMSVMMMVTFMPAMAFAAETGWADDNSYYQVVSGTTVTKYKVVKKFIKVTYNSTDNEYNWSDGQVWIGAYDNDDTLKASKFLGYNLEKAFASEVSPVIGNPATATPKAWKETRTKFESSELNGYFGAESMVNVTKITFNVPSDVENISTDNGVTLKSAAGKVINGKELAITELKGGDNGTTAFTGTASFKSTTPKYNPDKKYEDQPFTLYLNPYFSNADTGKYFYGETPGREITVVKSDSKKAEELTLADYEFDGKAINTTTGTDKVMYNGGEHKVVQSEYAGITSTYKLLNEKTGKYEDVQGDLVVKNAGTYHVIATAVNASDSKDTKKTYFDIEVTKAYTAMVGFKKSAINVSGAFDAKDYLTATATYETTGNGIIVDNNRKKASEKAVNKDEETILAYFNEMYDIVLTDKGDGYQKATAEEKDLTPGEKKAIEEKYEDLLGNYGYTTSTKAVEESAVATFKVIDNITFSKAPLYKTYKAKKGKLPKTKTFKVAAKAASGTALVYKIKSGAGKIKVNATNGKVTVKKGLKKGTYKVGVYAITVDTFGGGVDKWVEDHYTLKIKVK